MEPLQTTRHHLWPYKYEDEVKIETCKSCGDEYPEWDLEDGICFRCLPYFDEVNF